jgi:two-component system chemotaxis response regulator CheY
MVVDDSRVVRQVACRILKDLGFDCSEAEDGEKAFEACREALPELIVIDWNMPVMSGYEFVEKVRRLENGAQPKIIFCTTENDAAMIQKALKAGANEYIMKPFNSDIIRSKLQKVGILPA